MKTSTVVVSVVMLVFCLAMTHFQAETEAIRLGKWRITINKNGIRFTARRQKQSYVQEKAVVAPRAPDDTELVTSSLTFERKHFMKLI